MLRMRRMRLEILFAICFLHSQGGVQTFLKKKTTTLSTSGDEAAWDAVSRLKVDPAHCQLTVGEDLEESAL